MDIEKLIPIARAGDTSACNQLGDYYYDIGNVKQAMEFYEIAAQNNDAEGLYNLGYCYVYSDQINNPSVGINYLKQAAELNHAKANKQLGFLLFFGKKVPEDLNQSFKYMKIAAELGDPDAQAHIAQCYEGGMWGADQKNFELAQYYYNLALAQNSKHAQWCVGCNYKLGQCGYPVDLKKAFYFFKKSAENGSAKGQLNLAICYWNGEGTAENHQEAYRWLEKAAKQGNADAMTRLGRILFYGVDCEISDLNMTRGRTLLQEAASQGFQEAIDELQEIEAAEEKFGPITAAKAKGNSTKKASGGCYVATAIYGSYDCPEVWILRRFRDNTLSETWYGRCFIHIYYLISPVLVKWFGNTAWFKALFAPILNLITNYLYAQGVDNTPYDDRTW